MADAASSSIAAVSRPYRGVSATDRRHQRRQRLIDAGLQLFGTRGIAAVGIVDVWAEAGLTKRYFYENFASIDALAEAVFEHVTGNLVATVAPAIEIGAGRDPRPALTFYKRALLTDPRVGRLLGAWPHTVPHEGSQGCAASRGLRPTPGNYEITRPGSQGVRRTLAQLYRPRRGYAP